MPRVANTTWVVVEALTVAIQLSTAMTRDAVSVRGIRRGACARP